MYYSLDISPAEISLIVLALALILDIVYSYHRGILYLIHPVHTCYVMGVKLAKLCQTKIYGCILWTICIIIHVVPVVLVLMFIYEFQLILYIILATWILKCSFSIRLLIDIAWNAYECMVRGNWDEARYWAQQLVRRDVYRLSEPYVISAVIESLAESLVDGIVSPLTYYPLLGVLGPYLQRLINTLDSAIGYKISEYREVGWFSARADTVINYVPARLTALYIVIAALVLGYDWRNSLRIYLRDRGRTESINAGHPMAAMAGALCVKLTKPRHYELGDEVKLLEPSDIVRAIRIVEIVTALHLTLITLLVIIRAISL